MQGGIYAELAKGDDQAPPDRGDVADVGYAQRGTIPIGWRSQGSSTLPGR